jgi:hypothetical protein
LGGLVLRSSVALFKVFLSIRDGDQSSLEGKGDKSEERLPSDGDKEELLELFNKVGNLISRGNIYFPDIDSGGSYSFQVDKYTLSCVTDSGISKLDFLLLQRWTEVDPDFGYKKTDYYRNRVWPIALFQNPDGTAERAGILTLSYKHWFAAKP